MNKLLNKSLILILQFINPNNNCLVINDSKTFWYVENPIVEVTNETFLSANQLIIYLINHQLLEKIDYLYAEYIDDIYQNNYMISGYYQVKVELVILSMDQYPIIDATINVIVPQQKTDNLTWFEYFINFILEVFHQIISLFL